MDGVDDLGGQLKVCDPLGEELIAAVTSAHSYSEAAKAVCKIRAVFGAYETGAILGDLADMLAMIENLGTLNATRNLKI